MRRIIAAATTKPELFYVNATEIVCTESKSEIELKTSRRKNIPGIALRTLSASGVISSFDTVHAKHMKAFGKHRVFVVWLAAGAKKRFLIVLVLYPNLRKAYPKDVVLVLQELIEVVVFSSLFSSG